MIKQSSFGIQFIFTFFWLFVLVSACKNNSINNRDHLVFRYNEHKNIGSLDPAFSKDLADIWATNQL